MYLQGQFNNTLYDVTKGNNPWGMGLGLQFFFNNLETLKPTFDLTADAYLEDDKVYRLYSDGTPINELGGMINVFAGASFHPIKTVFLSFVAGPSFISGQKALFGIKPSAGFYFSQNKKWTGKVSYINVYSRDERTKGDFGSMSFSLGLKVF